MFDNLPDHVFESCIGPWAKAVAEVNAKEPLHTKVCAMEEMSELTKEIAKCIRYRGGANKQQMAEEIGHVVLMAFALMYDSGIEVEMALKSMANAVERMMYANNVPKYNGVYFRDPPKPATHHPSNSDCDKLNGLNDVRKANGLPPIKELDYKIYRKFWEDKSPEGEQIKSEVEVPNLFDKQAYSEGEHS